MDLPTGSADDLCDEPADPTVRESNVVFDGMIFDVRRDEVELGQDDTVTREFVEHPGAVVIVALREIDGVDLVVVIRQYRHPVRTREWELPAGILDEPGEDPRAAAARELAEEVELSAGRWDVLLDFYSSPGMTSEALRVFLARDVEDKHDGDFHRTGEEAGITGLWVPLDEAHTAVLAGQIHNPGAVIGILAAWGARQKSWSTLRPADSPWPWYA
jgi:ADP-ribose pyrophosphatase